MSSVTRTVKYSLITLNVVIFCSGLIMLIAGSVVQGQINTQNLSKTIGGYSTQSGSIVCILFGIAILAFSLLGLYGTMKDSYKFLVGYASILSFVFLIQIITGITGLSVKNSSKFNELVQKVFDNEFKYNSTQAAERDQFQRYFKCCGWKSYEDYKDAQDKLVIPESCCIQKGCNVTDIKNNIFKDGCNMKLTDAIRQIIEVACIILVIFSLFNLLSIILSFFLAKQIRSGYQYT